MLGAYISKTTLSEEKKSAKNDEFFYRRLLLLTNILSNIFLQTKIFSIL